MNFIRTRMFIFVGIAVFVLAGVGVFLLRDYKTLVIVQGPQSQLERTIAFDILVKNTSAQPQQNAEVLVYVPNKKTTVQQCGLISSNYEYTTQTDPLDNQIARFMFDTIPPFGTKIINLSAKLSFLMPPPNTDLKDKDFFLSEERYVEISSDELVKFAERFATNSPRESVKNIYEWVTASIRPMPYSAKERGALYAFRKRKGDCTEFMHLFIALCRLNNIPARGVSGFVVTQDKRVQPDDFHDWTEVYLDGRWRLVDPFNKVFMERQNEYIVMRLHGPGGDDFDFHRWKSKNDHLQITMAR